MPDDHDIPMTDEELARAREGEALIAAAVSETHAPQSLRESIERERERAAARARTPFWRRRRLGLALGGIAGALLVAVIALQAGETSTEPTLAKVTGAARLEARKPAPRSIGGTPPNLDARVENLVFPDWEAKFGWRAVGRRDDTLSGRSVTTVVYRNPEGARLGYAVVSGDELDAEPPGRPVTRDGKTYHVARAGGRTVVTWTQQGHTCVIAARATVPSTRLVDLAASRNV
ncbi:MAG TPA: hypothetical protein VE466_00040 [Acidimicrobiales bacterium]|nr:hypothetical protein [Acidimicrobiales bacterium]HZB05287.1 hypothetical protein [Thermoleophilaceae bacterium]